MAVTREPTAEDSPPVRSAFSRSLSASGCSTVRKPSAFACTQPGRSTITTGAVAEVACSPVNSRTWCSESAAN